MLRAPQYPYTSTITEFCNLQQFGLNFPVQTVGNSELKNSQMVACQCHTNIIREILQIIFVFKFIKQIFLNGFPSIFFLIKYLCGHVLTSTHQHLASTLS
jgi:hypothetical protein